MIKVVKCTIRNLNKENKSINKKVRTIILMQNFLNIICMLKQNIQLAFQSF